MHFEKIEFRIKLNNKSIAEKKRIFRDIINNLLK